MWLHCFILTYMLVITAGAVWCEESPNFLVDVYRQELQKEQETLYKPISELNELYRKSLEALKTKHQQAGNLNQVLAVDSEIAAIGSGNPTDPGEDNDLRRLQKTYFEAKATRSKGLEEKFADLIDGYLKKLETLQSELTREGKLGDAVAVRDEHEFVSKLVEGETLIPVADWAEKRRRLSLIPEDAVELDGNKYAVIEETLNWNEAQAKCEQLGGNLVSIGSRKEDELVASLRGSRDFLWIGLVSDESGKDWRWVDGSESKFTDWRDNRPDNNGGINAVVMNRWNEWDDTPPDSTNVTAFVCEWE
ncbi:MAG: hypothetical protein CMO55_21955 [Verrucomicrobiales bacterium]|nr:hypothetical protein [Verrucomicrobiales bacterium]